MNHFFQVLLLSIPPRLDALQRLVPTLNARMKHEVDLLGYSWLDCEEVVRFSLESYRGRDQIHLTAKTMNCICEEIGKWADTIPSPTSQAESSVSEWEIDRYRGKQQS